MAGVFDYLRFRAFAHATEDAERVRVALRQAAGSDKLAFQESFLEGSHGNPIVVLEADLKANRAIRELFVGLARDDPSGLRRLMEEAERRIDENLNFYFRFDKQEAYLARRVVASDDDAIHVRARFRSFRDKQIPPADELRGFLGEIAKAAAK